MRITILDELVQEIVILLYQQQWIRLEQAVQLSGHSIDHFYQLLVHRNLVTVLSAADENSDELILASLGLSIQ